MTLTLDIANELYPLAASETFALAVARSLVPDEQDTGSVDGDADGDGAAPKKVKRELWRSGDQGLASDYEYVMYGKVSVSPRPRYWRVSADMMWVGRFTNSTIRRRGIIRRALSTSHC